MLPVIMSTSKQSGTFGGDDDYSPFSLDELVERPMKLQAAGCGEDVTVFVEESDQGTTGLVWQLEVAETGDEVQDPNAVRVLADLIHFFSFLAVADTSSVFFHGSRGSEKMRGKRAGVRLRGYSTWASSTFALLRVFCMYAS